MKEHIELASVPSPWLRGLFEHEVKNPSLFSFEYSGKDCDSDWRTLISPEQKEDLAEDYVHDWTLAEIEILIALFFKAKGEDSVFVRSEYELIKIASGKKERSRHLSGALESLQREKTFILKDQGHRFCKIAPISVTKQENGLLIQFSRPIALLMDSFIKIPLAPSSYFRKGGLRRVEKAHLLLYLYLRERIHGHKKSKNFQIEPLFCAMGVKHYFEQRNGHRAMKILETGLIALEKSFVLSSFQFLSKDQVEIIPDRFHFGIKEENEKRAQVTLKGAQVTLKRAQVTKRVA